MGRYQLQTKQVPAPGARLTAECYFERAMEFAPKDGVVHMLYGIYLARKGDLDAALDRYLEALQMTPDSTELHYNLGLLYADMKRYDDALDEAHVAYGAGFPLLGLRNKLLRAGAWRDPPPEAPASPDAATETQPESESSQPSAPAPDGADGDTDAQTAQPDDAASAEPEPVTEEP
jgi:Flp pilus assembly protein TadD